MVNEIAKYDFTETSGITLDDSSGNNYDATITELVFSDGFWQQNGTAPSANWSTPYRVVMAVHTVLVIL